MKACVMYAAAAASANVTDCGLIETLSLNLSILHPGNIMNTRRQFFRVTINGALCVLAAGEVVFACNPFRSEEDIAANEDLMREHGVLRRALLVYSLSAKKLRSNPAAVAPDPLHKTARLFRSFGEDYHERALEEPFIFPKVKQSNGPAAPIVDVLLAQHQRGRQITDYVLTVTRGPILGDTAARQLSDALDSFVLMYQEHTAREDTIVFPAWHKMLSHSEYNEMSERFEEIEQRQFGKDGFDDAVKEISDIERTLALSDLGQFTAPQPPTIQ